MEHYEHPLSWKALARVVSVCLLVFLAWKALAVLVNILIALILATAIYPFVKKLHSRMPLLLSIIVVMAILLIPFVLLGVFVVPDVVRQFPDLLNTFYGIINQSHFLPQALQNFNFGQYLAGHTGDILASTATVVSTIISVVTVFFLAFYFMLDHERLLEFFLDIFPNTEQAKIKAVLTELAKVNGQYIRGNVLISIICAAVLFIGLLILNVPFALPLAIFAGILDLLPLVGSTLGAIPAVVLGFAMSPVTGLLVVALHLLYQQTENANISPAIYNKALNISPALSFLAVVIGGGLFGIVGAFLALPIAASIPPALKYTRTYFAKNNQ